MLQYFKSSDGIVLDYPVELTDNENTANEVFGAGKWLLKELPDSFCIDCIAVTLDDNGNIREDTVKTSAKVAEEKIVSDNELRQLWYDMAKSGDGTSDIPTVKYYIENSTGYDNYSPVIQKVQQGIMPTDDEWKIYNSDFVIPE